MRRAEATRCPARGRTRGARFDRSCSHVGEAALRAKIATRIEQRDHANNQHVLYELSETALQIGIVLAGISILARRRWLLAGGGLVGLAGIVLLFVGLIY